MKESIESGTQWIEDPSELGLIIDDLNFSEVEDVSLITSENEDVYDLEIENQKNYDVNGLGIVHNGGGK